MWKKKNFIVMCSLFLSMIIFLTACDEEKIETAERLEKNSKVNLGQKDGVEIEFVGIDVVNDFLGYSFSFAVDQSMNYLSNKYHPDKVFYDVCFRVSNNSTNEFYTNPLFNTRLENDKNSYQTKVVTEKSKNLELIDGTISPNKEGYLHFVALLPADQVRGDYKLSLIKDNDNGFEYIVNLEDVPIEKKVLKINDYVKKDDNFSIKFVKSYSVDVLKPSKPKKENGTQDFIFPTVDKNNKLAVLEFELESKIEKTTDLYQIIGAVLVNPEPNITHIYCENETGAWFSGRIRGIGKTKLYIITEIDPRYVDDASFKVIVDGVAYHYIFNEK